MFGDSGQLYILIGASGFVMVGIAFALWWMKKKNSSAGAMKVFAQQEAKHYRSRVGGSVMTFLKSGEFTMAFKALLRRHKYDEAARILLLMGKDLEAAKLFLKGKRFEEAAKLFVQLEMPLDAAQAYTQAGRIDLAADLYLKSQRPLDAAQLYLQINKEEKALDLLKKHASEYEYLNVYARILLKKGEYIKAAQAFARAGNFKDAAQAFEMAGEFARAAQAYINANMPANAAKAMENVGDFTEAAKLYEMAGMYGEAARVSSGNLVSDSDIVRLANKGDLFNAGVKAFKEKNYPLAERFLRAIKPDQPGYVRSSLLLGKICKEDGRLEEAHNYFRSYIMSAPVTQDTLGAFKFCINFFKEQGDIETAIETLHRIRKAKLLNDELRSLLSELEEQRSKQLVGDTVSLETWIAKKKKEINTKVKIEVIKEVLKDYYIGDQIRDSGVVATFAGYKDKKPIWIRILHAAQMIPNPQLQSIKALLQKAKHLNNPFIPGIIETGNMGSSPYVVCEAPKGVSLKDWLENNRPDFLTKKKVLIRIGEAIRAIHSEAIVIKGLTPEMIFITPDYKGLNIAGIFLPEGRLDEMRRFIWGNDLFISPEVKQGENITSAADLYSFAMIIIFVLSNGVLPDKNTYDKPKLLLSKLKELDPSLPLGLMAMLNLTIGSDARSRPASCQEILKELP